MDQRNFRSKPKITSSRTNGNNTIYNDASQGNILDMKSNDDRSQMLRINAASHSLRQNPPNRIARGHHHTGPQSSEASRCNSPAAALLPIEDNYNAVQLRHNRRSGSLPIGKTARSHTPLQLVPPTAYIYSQGETPRNVINNVRNERRFVPADLNDTSSDRSVPGVNEAFNGDVYVEDVYFKPSAASLFPSSLPRVVSSDQFPNNSVISRGQSQSLGVSPAMGGRRRSDSVNKDRDTILSTLYPDNNTDSFVCRQVTGRRHYPININNSSKTQIQTFNIDDSIDSDRSSLVGRRKGDTGYSERSMSSPQKSARQYQALHNQRSYERQRAKELSSTGELKRTISSNDVLSLHGSMSRDDGIRHSTVSMKPNSVNDQSAKFTPKPHSRTIISYKNRDEPSAEKGPIVVKGETIVTGRQTLHDYPKEKKHEPPPVFVFTLRKNEQLSSKKRRTPEDCSSPSTPMINGMVHKSTTNSDIDNETVNSHVSGRRAAGGRSDKRSLTITRDRLRQVPPSLSGYTRTPSTTSVVFTDGGNNTGNTIRQEIRIEHYNNSNNEEIVEDDTYVDIDPSGPTLHPRIPYSSDDYVVNGEVKHDNVKAQKRNVEKVQMDNINEKNSKVQEKDERMPKEQNKKGEHKQTVQEKDVHKQTVQERDAHKQTVQEKDAHKQTVQEKDAHKQTVQERDAHKQTVQERDAHKQTVQEKGERMPKEQNKKDEQKQTVQKKDVQTSNLEEESLPVCSTIVRSNFIWDSKASWESGVLQWTDGGDDKDPGIIESHIVAMDKDHIEGPF